ncbi:hypothetical protein LTR84_004303 [Exophiala bonariae]|uniref:MalT-like TPR region domain-containing protein n=1 Tax=Exophiala bonariae TaxID=1690606 RepID=A0AAV9N6J5_9EURO|nr:hypothetical protein LTR84_004303 [Exophiala bonariae]
MAECAIGQLYRHMGRLKESLRLLEDVLERTEERLGPSHSTTMEVMWSLANTYDDNSDIRKAEKLYSRLKTITESLLHEVIGDSGDAHLTRTNAINIDLYLGRLYTRVGKLKLARGLLLQARDDAVLHLGTKNFQMDYAYLMLGWNYAAEGDLAEAERLISYSAVRPGDVFDEDSPIVAFFISQLGELYYLQGRLDQAEQILRSCVTTSEITLGKDDVTLISWKISPAEICVDQDRLDEAKTSLDHIIASLQDDSGSEPSAISVCFRARGKVHTRQKFFDEAEAAFRRSLKIASSNGVDEGPEALWCLLDLGRCYHDQGRLTEAKDAVGRAIHVHRQNEAPKTQWLLACLYELGRICQSGEVWDEAERAYVEAHAGYERVLGLENERTKKAAQALIDLRDARTMPNEATTVGLG